jgi:myo-inositol 2-dehydrogenase/D-chiro-inositol 1-dehydrogenase
MSVAVVEIVRPSGVSANGILVGVALMSVTLPTPVGYVPPLQRKRMRGSSTEETVRIALLGAGRIGALHARLLSATAGVDSLVVADVEAERAARVAGAIGATAAPSIEAALDAADAVVIAAATAAHPALIRTSIGRGLPTFCEKPLATGLEETAALADDIDRSRIPFQLGFQRRFDPAYREAHRLIHTGALGTLYAIRLAGHDPAPAHEAYIAQSGGLFRDFAIHDFDALRWLTGCEVDEVYADGAVRGFPVYATYDDVDTAVAVLRLVDGPLTVLTATRHDPLGYDIRAEIFGSTDSVSVGLGPRTPLRSIEPGVPPPAGPAWPDFLVRFESAYAAELAAFVEVARGNAPSPCTAQDGVAALRIAEAADRSRREHRPVRLAAIAG